MADQFLSDRLTGIEAIIVQLEKTILDLTLNPQAEYTIDTGQSSRRVKYQDLGSMKTQLKDLIIMRQEIKNLLNN
jgi:hypothetical protein